MCARRNRMLTWFISTKKIAKPRSASIPSRRSQLRDSLVGVVVIMRHSRRPLTRPFAVVFSVLFDWERRMHFSRLTVVAFGVVVGAACGGLGGGFAAPAAE